MSKSYKMSRVRYSRSNKCYIPSEGLRKLMNGLSKLELGSIELKKKEDAKEITKQEASKQRLAMETGKRNLERTKVDVLNNDIFPSMANLTVLLEYMLEFPSIHKLFERDLKELFFAKSAVNKNKRSIFERFIEASCMTTIRGTNKDGVEDSVPLPDFRLILCWMMQKSVFHAMQAIGMHKFRDANFLNKTLLVDIDRALAWTSEVSDEAWTQLRSQKKKEKRPALF